MVRPFDLLDEGLLVDEILRRVAAVRTDPGRQPLAGEQLVHGDPGEPCYRSALANGSQAPTRSRRNRSAVRTALCSLGVRSFTTSSLWG